MSTVLTDAINALVTYSNSVTGASDTTLSEAVATLAAGYQGGGTGTITYPAVNGMPLTAAINALIAYSNQVTGASDTTASEAVATLAAGYGGGGLPSAYQEVEWIGTPASGDKPYINTGIIANATEYHMTAKYLNTSSSDSYGLGTRLNGSSATQCCFFGRYNANSQWAWQGYFFGPSAGQDIIHIADAVFQNGSQVTTVDGTTNTNNKTGDFNGTMPFFVFCRNHGSGNFGSYAYGMRYYYLQMRLDGVLVRDFIPCYRKSDGEIGMYDLVSNSFFTNAGSGTFEKGNDV